MEEYKKSKKFVNQVVTELLRSKDDQLIRTMARHETARRGLIKRIDTLEVDVDSKTDEVKAVKDEVAEYDRTIHVLNRALVANMSDRDAAKEVTYENLRRRDAVSTAAQSRSSQQQADMEKMRHKLRSMEHELSARKQSESTLTANIAALKRALEMLLAKAENVMDVKGAQAVEQLIQDAEQDIASMKEINGDPKLMKLAQERQKDIQEMSKVKKEMDKLHLEKKNMEQALRKAEQDVVQMRLRLMERDSAMAMAGKRVKAFETKLEEETTLAAKRVAEAEKHAVEVTKRFEEKMAILVKNMDEKERQLGEQTRMADHYRTQAQEEKSRLTRLRQELLEAQEEAENILRSNYTKEKNRADQLEKDLSARTADLTERLQRAEMMARENDDEREVTKNQLAMALARLQEAQNACDDKEAEILELQATLESIQHIAARKEADLVRAQSSISLLTAERDQQMDRLEQIALASIKLQDDSVEEAPGTLSPTAAGLPAGKQRKGRTPKALDLSSPPDGSLLGDALDSPHAAQGKGGKRATGKAVKIATDGNPSTLGGGNSPDNASSPTNLSRAFSSSIPSLNPPKLSPRSERTLRHHTVVTEALHMATSGNAIALQLALEALQKKLTQITDWRTSDERAQHPAIAKRLDLTVQEITAAILTVIGSKTAATTSEASPSGSSMTGPDASPAAATRANEPSHSKGPTTGKSSTTSVATPASSSASTTAQPSSGGKPKKSTAVSKTTTHGSSRQLGSSTTKPATSSSTTRGSKSRRGSQPGMLASVDVMDSDQSEPEGEDDDDMGMSTTTSGPGDSSAALHKQDSGGRGGKGSLRKKDSLIEMQRRSPPPSTTEATVKPPPASLTTVMMGFDATTAVTSELRPRAAVGGAQSTPFQMDAAPLLQQAASITGNGVASTMDPSLDATEVRASSSHSTRYRSPGLLSAEDFKMPVSVAAVSTSMEHHATRDSAASPMAPKTPPTMSERGTQVELLTGPENPSGQASTTSGSGSTLAARKAQRTGVTHAKPARSPAPFVGAASSSAAKDNNSGTSRRDSLVTITAPGESTPPHTTPKFAARHESDAPALGPSRIAAAARSTTSEDEWRVNNPVNVVETLLAVAADFDEAIKMLITAESADRVSLQAQLTRKVWQEFSAFRSAVARSSNDPTANLAAVQQPKRMSLTGTLQRSGTMKPSDATLPAKSHHPVRADSILGPDNNRRLDRHDMALQLQSAVAVLNQLAAHDDVLDIAHEAPVIPDRPMSKAQQLRFALTDVTDRVTSLVHQTELELRAPPPSAASTTSPLRRDTSAKFGAAPQLSGTFGFGSSIPRLDSPAAEVVHPRALSPMSSDPNVLMGTPGADSDRGTSPMLNEAQSSMVMLPRMSSSIRSPPPAASVVAVLQAVGAFLREAQTFADGLSSNTASVEVDKSADNVDSRSSSPLSLSPSGSPVRQGSMARKNFGKQAGNQLSVDQVSSRLRQVLDKIRLGVQLKEQEARHALLASPPLTNTSSSQRPSPQLNSSSTPGLDGMSNRDAHLELKKRKQQQLKDLLRRRRATEDEEASSGSDADMAGKRGSSGVTGAALGGRKYTFVDGKPAVAKVTVDAAVHSQDDLWNTEKIDNLAQEYVNAQATNARLFAEVDELMNFIQNEPDLRRIADAVTAARGTAPRVHLDDSDDDRAADQYDPVVRARKARERAVQKTLQTVRQRLEALELEQLFEDNVRKGIALALATDAAEPVRAVGAAETLAETRSRSLRAVIGQITQQVADAEHGGHFVADMMKSFPRAVVTHVAKSGCAPAVTSELVVQLADWWNEWRKRAQDAGAERTQQQQQSLERLMHLCDRLETAALTSATEFSTAVVDSAPCPVTPSRHKRPTVVPVTGENLSVTQTALSVTPIRALPGVDAGSPAAAPDVSLVLHDVAATPATSGLPYLLQRHAIMEALEGDRQSARAEIPQDSLVATHLLETAQMKREALLSRLGDDRLCHTPGAFSCTAPPGTSSMVNRPLKTSKTPLTGDPTNVFSLPLGQRDMRAGLESRGSLRSSQARRPGTVAAREQHVTFDSYIKATLPKVQAVSSTPHETHDEARAVTPPPALVPRFREAEEEQQRRSTASVVLPPVSVTPPPATFVPPPTAAAGMRRRAPLPTAASQPLERDRVMRQVVSRGLSRSVDDDLGRHWNSAARTPVVKTRPPRGSQ